MPTTLGIDAVTFDGITFAGEQEHQMQFEKREIQRAGGAADFIQETATVERFFRVLIIHDDVTTRNAMIAKIEKENTLVVKAKQMNAVTLHTYTYINARYIGPRGSDFFGNVGNFVEEFICRSADGLASPLTVT